MENQIKFRRPKVKIHHNGNLEHIEDWVLDYNGYRIVHKKGDISDGNSVPWLFRRIVPKFGKNTISGIVHDRGYRDPEVLIVLNGVVVGKKSLTRKEWDVIRKDIGEWCGVGWLESWAGYAGLRMGGWSAWSYHRKKESLFERTVQ
jgi:hypothetical protein